MGEIYNNGALRFVIEQKCEDNQRLSGFDTLKPWIEFSKDNKIMAYIQNLEEK